MVVTQEIQDIYLDKENFNKKTWKKLLDLFGVDEDIKDRPFSIDVWKAEAIAKPARKEDY